jgi:hypothetical protein
MYKHMSFELSVIEELFTAAVMWALKLENKVKLNFN